MVVVCTITFAGLNMPELVLLGILIDLAENSLCNEMFMYLFFLIPTADVFVLF
jgi:hypothetical protein